MSEDKLGVQVPNRINAQVERIADALASCRPYGSFYELNNRYLLETVKDAVEKMAEAVETAERIYERRFRGISLKAGS